MQRQCMHATGHLQLLRKHLINSLMPFNLHLPRKGRRHHGHLEVRLRIRRHAVLVTLVLHLKNAGVERLIQLGFNCILHFHYFLTPQFALYVVAISLSLKRLWASASQKCVCQGWQHQAPMDGFTASFGKPTPAAATSRANRLLQNKQPPNLDTQQPNSHIPHHSKSRQNNTKTCSSKSPKNPALAEPLPPPSPAPTKKARAGSAVATAVKLRP